MVKGIWSSMWLSSRTKIQDCVGRLVAYLFICDTSFHLHHGWAFLRLSWRQFDVIANGWCNYYDGHCRLTTVYSSNVCIWYWYAELMFKFYGKTLLSWPHCDVHRSALSFSRGRPGCKAKNRTTYVILTPEDNNRCVHEAHSKWINSLYAWRRSLGSYFHLHCLHYLQECKSL